MINRIGVVLIFFTLATLACSAQDGGWKHLFNGKDLTGWKHVGPGEMYVEDGLIKTRGGMGLLYWTGGKVGDCVIRVVYRMRDENSNAGVFIRVPLEPREEWMPVYYGYEVQIADGGDPFHRTGSIYSLAPSSAVPAKGGEWRTMIITLAGERILVDLDGRHVSSLDLASPTLPPRKQWHEPKREPKRPEAGYIGLQNHDPGDVVWFKEVSVQPLPSVDAK